MMTLMWAIVAVIGSRHCFMQAPQGCRPDVMTTCSLIV
jgi:hypothetical protein